VDESLYVVSPPSPKAKKRILRSQCGNRLMSVNEEDGLSFRILQETTGERHLRALWDGEEVEDVERLVDLIKENEMWPVYRLRAISLVQDRVQAQLTELVESEGEVAWIAGHEAQSVGGQELFVASRLRELERRLLEKAVGVFEAQVTFVLDI
jgi:hypothetical protein